MALDIVTVSYILDSKQGQIVHQFSIAFFNNPILLCFVFADYGSWYLYVWIPLAIIAIIRCCCYYNQKKEREAQTVYVDQGRRPTGQTVVNTQMTAGSTVVNPPQYQHAPHYGQPQGAVINSAYTPDPAGTAYPPNAPGLPLSAQFTWAGLSAKPRLQPLSHLPLRTMKRLNSPNLFSQFKFLRRRYWLNLHPVRCLSFREREINSEHI